MPPSLPSPPVPLQFASNILFGRFVLQQHVAGRMYVGTAIVIASTIMVVLTFAYAPTDEEEWGIAEITHSFTKPAYVAFLILMCGLAFVLFFVTKKLREDNLADPDTINWKNTLEPVTYAAFSAIFGTQAVVQAKCLALLLKVGGAAFQHYLIYLMLVGWLVFVFVWLTRMNDALGKYERERSELMQSERGDELARLVPRAEFTPYVWTSPTLFPSPRSHRVCVLTLMLTGTPRCSSSRFCRATTYYWRSSTGECSSTSSAASRRFTGRCSL